MKNSFYALALLPLLFGACNSSEEFAPSPNVINSTSSTVVNKRVNNSITTTTNGTIIKYVSKPLIIEEGLLHIKGFMGTLQPTLKGALKQDKSSVTAMSACSSMALQMTDEYNNVSSDVKIRRTALKYRNPKNKPDNIDKEVMYRLEAVKDFKPVAVDMGDRYRVYKPLKTGVTCLLCHAERDQMSSKIVNMIQKKYPNDLAVGFKLNDFRGVVVAEIRKRD
jgi:hypothetical protein